MHILLLKRLAESTVGFTKSEEFGYWNESFDESVKLLYVWLGALPRMTDIP
uniref:Uncharacterized protein n=1 Tax=Steinernema glaseri TaxID=37863 RepID=A0A1I7YAI5_9BILA